jgi:phospholipid transport system substrate-binding protein
MSRLTTLLLCVMLAPLAQAADAPPAAASTVTAASTPAAPAATAAPGATVQTFHDALLVSMKTGKTATCAARTTALGAAIDTTFDLPFIAQRVLRRHWDALSDAQRKAFLTTFRELVISTYVQNFSEYSGEQFTPPTDLQGGTGTYRTIKTLLKPTDGDAVTFEYQLHDTPGGWRIVNIIADGVSDLALRTVQYDRVLNDHGFDSLLQQLREQTVKNQSGC